MRVRTVLSLDPDRNTHSRPEIVAWVMNTFSSALQLFSESGLSYTIEGGQSPGTIVGLDPGLRFRLTDCPHEEQGQFINSIFPENAMGSGVGIRILGATLATRTSIAVRAYTNEALSPRDRSQDIIHETHKVFGLRLSGMKETEHVWAKTEMPMDTAARRIWSDVSAAGLTDDVPAPFLGLGSDSRRSRREIQVVKKDSMITPVSTEPCDGLGRLWM